MEIVKIKNPKTGRDVSLKAWPINPRETLEWFRADASRSYQDLSYKLLADRRAVATMAAQEYGDSSRNNFGLSVFENALDWRLGSAVMGYINAMIGHRKCLPKAFRVGASRSGQVFIVTASGRVIDMGG